MIRQPEQVWQEFAARHENHPFLKLDPLYALTEDVIVEVQEHVDGFFTPEQESFERDLARTAGGGFFLRRVFGKPVQPESDSGRDPFGNPIRTTMLPTVASLKPGMTVGEFIEELALPPPQAAILRRLAPILKVAWLPDSNRDQALQAIHDLIGALARTDGQSPRDHEACRAQEQLEEQGMRQRQEAYAGWLVTDPVFRAELAVLRVAHGPEITRRGGFPPRSKPTGRPGNQRGPRSTCVAAFKAFYQRWGLEGMDTWDLPVPLDARLNTLFPGDVELPTTEGILIFAPWYLLRGGRLDLRQVVRRLRQEEAPRHLHGWVHKEPGADEDAAGDLLYQRFFWLYRCYVLTLAHRYPSACRRNVERLDRAMGAVMGRGEDLVKKLRQRLKRDLARIDRACLAVQSIPSTQQPK